MVALNNSYQSCKDIKVLWFGCEEVDTAPYTAGGENILLYRFRERQKNTDKTTVSPQINPAGTGHSNRWTWVGKWGQSDVLLLIW